MGAGRRPMETSESSGKVYWCLGLRRTIQVGKEAVTEQLPCARWVLGAPAAQWWETTVTHTSGGVRTEAHWEALWTRE